jgi:hypothetical protein
VGVWFSGVVLVRCVARVGPASKNSQRVANGSTYSTCRYRCASAANARRVSLLAPTRKEGNRRQEEARIMEWWPCPSCWFFCFGSQRLRVLPVASQPAASTAGPS